MTQSDLYRAERLTADRMYLEGIAYYNVCVMCTSPLAVSWNGQKDTFEITCSKDRNHQGWERLKSLYQKWQDGEALPVEVAGALEHKYERRKRMATTKAHTKYHLKSGEIVPSVTTVLSILSKPALIHWAWDCGMKGEDYRKVRDNAADIGTLAHYLIRCHLRGETPDTAEYSPANLSKAETCLLRYWDWEKGKNLKPLMIEQPLVSERYGYGGTIDCLAKVDGDLVLIDHKTGKAIYNEMFYQLAAYKHLLWEAAPYSDLNRAMILRIGKEESEGFEVREAGNLETEWDIFQACLQIWKLQHQIPLKTGRGEALGTPPADTP